MQLQSICNKALNSVAAIPTRSISNEPAMNAVVLFFDKLVTEGSYSGD
jgi:hypothetical protein